MTVAIRKALSLVAPHVSKHLGNFHITWNGLSLHEQKSRTEAKYINCNSSA